MLDALHGSDCAASLGGCDAPKPLQGPHECCEGGSAAIALSFILILSQAFICMNKSETQGGCKLTAR